MVHAIDFECAEYKRSFLLGSFIICHFAIWRKGEFPRMAGDPLSFLLSLLRPLFHLFLPHRLDFRSMLAVNRHQILSFLGRELEFFRFRRKLKPLLHAVCVGSLTQLFFERVRTRELISDSLFSEKVEFSLEGPGPNFGFEVYCHFNFRK